MWHSKKNHSCFESTSPCHVPPGPPLLCPHMDHHENILPRAPVCKCGREREGLCDHCPFKSHRQDHSTVSLQPQWLYLGSQSYHIESAQVSLPVRFPRAHIHSMIALIDPLFRDLFQFIILPKSFRLSSSPQESFQPQPKKEKFKEGLVWPQDD